MKGPKHEIYDYVFAHRGFHVNFSENTLEAYMRAVKQNFAIELDIRILKCGTIVCFHDRYMKRLVSVPGRISKRTFNEIKRYKILNSKSKIPTLDQALDVINGTVPLLIEIKGLMDESYRDKLVSILSKYDGKVFFHTKNIITYFRARKIWNDNVFYILNPFRKRFNFVKGKDYKNVKAVPTIDNIMVEAEDSAKTVIKKIWIAFNQYKSRVKDDHWLISYNGKKNQIQHRGIIDKTLKEHSKESFELCIKNKKIIEFDITKYEGKIICYHDDGLTKRMGQKKSICEKLDIEDSLLFSEVLSFIDGRTPIIIDIKDFKIFDRSFENEIMSELSNYNGKFVVQSFNPYVVMYFMKQYPNIVRGQVGHSLNGLKKSRKVMLTICNFCLFYKGRPDYIVYDLDIYVHLLSRFNNIIGLPVIGYAATEEEDIIKYFDFFDNFIVEGNFAA
jgi:glycerophosphoryl diester phosphodiesterase